jgi:hypothetical protein
MRSRQDLQVGAPEVRQDIGAGGAAALAVLLRDLVHEGAFLRRAVAVGDVRHAVGSRCGKKSLVERAWTGQMHYVQRPPAVVQLEPNDALCSARLKQGSTSS